MQGVHDSAHDVCGITLGEDEWNAQVGEPRHQLLQAAVIPPPSGRTERARTVPVVVFIGPAGFVDPQCHHWSMCCRAGGRQGRVVSQTEIVAKPD